MSYLKALGVFRLVAEQADSSARLSWANGVARLESKLDRNGIVDFFQNQFVPTPIVGPWGARSGFYPGSSEASARQALDAIVGGAKGNSRLQAFREAIVEIRGLLERHGFTQKVRDEDKLALMRFCRNELPDFMIPWLDAVYILTDESRKFPPLLGTGGNEGSGSYVSTFAQVLVALLVERESIDGIGAALFSDFVSEVQGMSVGHFNPGGIGGVNSSQGFDGGGGVNPWDYLLALEGSILFAGAAARRLRTESTSLGSYPFCVEAVAVGYASESDKEASEGTRAELWLPLWRQGVTIKELSQLLSEGRVQLGRRQARHAVEFALALATLGISRGIDSFVRFAFVKRNGLSYFAAPLGTVQVTPRPKAQLITEQPLLEWVEALRRACSDKTPARYQAGLRGIDRAMFGFANRSDQSEEADQRELVNVLVALGKAEQILAGGLAFCKDKYLRPLAGLSPQWLDQADDGSVEFRLAASLAGIRGVRDSDVGPFRVFMEGVAVRGSGFEWNASSTSVVWSHQPLASNLAAVFRRRQIEAFREGVVGVPLRSSRPALLTDVLAFFRDEVDGERLTSLLWAFTAVNWSAVETDVRKPLQKNGFGLPIEFGVPRLLVESIPLAPKNGEWRWEDDAPPSVPDASIFGDLRTGRSDAVALCVERASRRLKSTGRLVNGARNRQQSGNHRNVISTTKPERLLAAMLFPLSHADIEVIANTVLYPPESEE